MCEMELPPRLISFSFGKADPTLPGIRVKELPSRDNDSNESAEVDPATDETILSPVWSFIAF